MVTLLVRGGAAAQVPAGMRRALKRQVLRALRAAGLEDAEICLSLSDDGELRELNRAYAGEDHATDVLSFSQAEGAPLPGPAAIPPAGARPLGDVIISVETAARQAQAAGHDLLHELLHLSVHGLCHLLGHDHATAEQERVMFGYEALLREQARRTGRIEPVPAPAPA